MAATVICEHFKFGHCKYLEHCRNQHIKDVCENPECDAISCNRRHPRPCRFYQTYGRCKFEPCSYKHIEPKEIILIKQLQSSLKEKSTEVEVVRNTLTDQTEHFKCLESELNETKKIVASIQAQIAAPSNLSHQDHTREIEKRIKEVEDTNYVLLHSIDDLEREVKVLQSKLSRLTSSY